MGRQSHGGTNCGRYLIHCFEMNVIVVKVTTKFASKKQEYSTYHQSDDWKTNFIYSCSKTFVKFFTDSPKEYTSNIRKSNIFNRGSRSIINSVRLDIPESVYVPSGDPMQNRTAVPRMKTWCPNRWTMGPSSQICIIPYHVTFLKCSILSGNTEITSKRYCPLHLAVLRYCRATLYIAARFFPFTAWVGMPKLAVVRDLTSTNTRHCSCSSNATMSSSHRFHCRLRSQITRPFSSSHTAARSSPAAPKAVACCSC